MAAFTVTAQKLQSVNLSSNEVTPQNYTFGVNKMDVESANSEAKTITLTEDTEWVQNGNHFYLQKGIARVRGYQHKLTELQGVYYEKGLTVLTYGTDIENVFVQHVYQNKTLSIVAVFTVNDYDEIVKHEIFYAPHAGETVKI